MAGFPFRTYYAAGQTLGFNYGNGLSAQFTYNDHLQLSALRYYNGSNDLFKLTYDYGTSNNGQIQQITDNVNGTSKSQSFIYDAWGRLRIAQTGSLTTPDLTSANTWKLEWTYDRIGNRLSQSQTGGTAANIVQPQLTVSDTTNRITTSGYTYDASGNMTSDSLHAYTYDAENRIKTLDAGGTYVYDGTGLRVKKGTTTYIWSGTKVIAEYSSTSLQTEYIYAGSQLLATLNAAGSPTYSHPDHLSIRIESDSSGEVTRTFGHLPFGDTWYESGAPGKRLFTGYERDNASGDSQLDYSVFRYYSSRLGRFMTTDPLAGAVQSPQSLNRYSYVANDPINATDPLGQMVYCSYDPVYGRTEMSGPNVVVSWTFSCSAGFPDPPPIGPEPKQGGNAGKSQPPPASPKKFKDEFYKRFEKMLNLCLKLTFGQDWGLVGHQNRENAPIVETRMNTAQLGAMAGIPAAVGIPKASEGAYGTVYIARELYYSSSGNSNNARYATYAHELANILEDQLALTGIPRHHGNPGATDDKDTGAVVEKCLFGKLQYPD